MLQNITPKFGQITLHEPQASADGQITDQQVLQGSVTRDEIMRHGFRLEVDNESSPDLDRFESATGLDPVTDRHSLSFIPLKSPTLGDGFLIAQGGKLVSIPAVAKVVNTMMALVQESPLADETKTAVIAYLQQIADMLPRGK